jgi:adenosine deaminase
MTSNVKLTRDFIERLPKTDLHVHLDGSVRIETLIDLAKKDKVELPTYDPEALKKIICCDESCESLDDYLQGFHIVNKVLQNKEALKRTAYELAEDCAKENIRYVEVRYSPILHTDKGMKLTQISEAVIDGLKQAEKDFNIKTNVIICGIRNMDPTTSVKLAELAIAYKNKGVIGFDLAGGENNYPAKDHKEAFDLALKNNLNIPSMQGKPTVRTASTKLCIIAVHTGLGTAPGYAKMAICSIMPTTTESRWKCASRVTSTPKPYPASGLIP